MVRIVCVCSHLHGGGDSVTLAPLRYFFPSAWFRLRRRVRDKSLRVALALGLVGVGDMLRLDTCAMRLVKGE